MFCKCNNGKKNREWIFIGFALYQVKNLNFYIKIILNNKNDNIIFFKQKLKWKRYWKYKYTKVLEMGRVLNSLFSVNITLHKIKVSKDFLFFPVYVIKSCVDLFISFICSVNFFYLHTSYCKSAEFFLFYVYFLIFYYFLVL